MHVDLNLNEYTSESPEKDVKIPYIVTIDEGYTVRFYLFIETMISMTKQKNVKNILFIINFYQD